MNTAPTTFPEHITLNIIPNVDVDTHWRWQPDPKVLRAVEIILDTDGTFWTHWYLPRTRGTSVTDSGRFSDFGAAINWLHQTLPDVVLISWQGRDDVEGDQ